MISPTSPDWPRQQAARIIRERIETGEYAEKLPSLEQLARELGVVPRTVQQALKILKAEGLVYGVAGRGVFIR
jgi:DNA-binding GntR family transcriptional regulator